MLLNKQSLISSLGKSISSTEVSTLKSLCEGSFVNSDFSFDNETYLICLEKGISLTFKDNLLSSIHLRFDEKDGYSTYEGWIGDEIQSEKNSLSSIQNLLGKPSDFGGGEEGFMGAIDPFWLRYNHHSYYIHYTFNEDQASISLVTIGYL